MPENPSKSLTRLKGGLNDLPLVHFDRRFKLWRDLHVVLDHKVESSAPYTASRNARYPGHTREVRCQAFHPMATSLVATAAARTSAFHRPRE